MDWPLFYEFFALILNQALILVAIRRKPLYLISLPWDLPIEMTILLYFTLEKLAPFFSFIKDQSSDFFVPILLAGIETNPLSNPTNFLPLIRKE